MIDSNDRDRLNDAREEMQRLLNEDELSNAALLVLANKQDLPNAMSVQEISERLGLDQFCRSQSKSYIQGTSATTGDGLYEAFDWLSSVVST